MQRTRLLASIAIAGSLAATTVALAVPSDAAPAQAASAHTVLAATQHGYPAARAAWIKGAHHAAAYQNRYWRNAEHHLQARRYRTERHELHVLMSIPLTDTTAQQRRTARHETRELNRFFHTSGLYGVSPHPYYHHARADWVKSGHVAAARAGHYLAAARHELAKSHRYGVERRELKQLAAIPLTSTTAKQRKTAHRLVHDLNRFFHLHHR